MNYLNIEQMDSNATMYTFSQLLFAISNDKSYFLSIQLLEKV